MRYLTFTDLIALCVSVILAPAVLIGTVAAYLGLFSTFATTLPFLLVLLGLASAFLLARNGFRIRLSPAEAVVLTLFAGSAVWNSGYYSESVLGEADSGVYAFSAVHLSKSGKWMVTDDEGFGVRSFGGFYDREGGVVPQFYPGYIVYLASAYAWGGIEGLFGAQGLLLFLTLALLYGITAKLTGNHAAGVGAAVIWATHYLTVWFSRQTLSENLLLPFILGATYFLIQLIRAKRSSGSLFAFLLPLIGASLVRLEGIVLLASFVTSAVLFSALNSDPEARLQVRRYLRRGIPALIVSGVSIIIGMYWLNPTYVASFFEKVLFRMILLLSGKGNTVLGEFSAYSHHYIWDSLIAYGFVPLMLMAVGGAHLSRYDKPVAALMVAFSPTLALFIDAFISIQHPWLMRHYWALLLPPLIILAIVAASGVGSRHRQASAARMTPTKFMTAIWATLIVALLILPGLLAAIPVMNLRENRGLLDGLHSTTSALPHNAVIVVTPDLAQLAAPLHFLGQKDSILITGTYTNESHLPDVGRALRGGSQIYVYTSHQAGPRGGFHAGSQFYNENLELVKDWSFEVLALEQDVAALRYIHSGNLSAGYEPFARGFSKIPPQDIVDRRFSGYIYKVNTSAPLPQFYASSLGVLPRLNEWREADGALRPKGGAALVDLSHPAQRVNVTHQGAGANLSVIAISDYGEWLLWSGEASGHTTTEIVIPTTVRPVQLRLSGDWELLSATAFR